MTEITDTISHPPLPEPAAYILAADLRRFKTEEVCAQACSVAFSTPDDGRSEPLFTAQQMREYRGMPDARPIETAMATSNPVLLYWRGAGWVRGRYVVDDRWDFRPRGWLSPYQGWRNDGDDVIPRNQEDCTHWQPLPAAPIEQATGEKK